MTQGGEQRTVFGETTPKKVPTKTDNWNFLSESKLPTKMPYRETPWNPSHFFQNNVCMLSVCMFISINL